MKMLEHWLPPEDAGQPLACLATSFTFDSDFFTEDCLSRFLSLATRDPEGATGLDLAGLLEEEERLAEARVCVLVDQSCRPEPRNLRWDLVPIRVRGGLLHAKVVVLIWERAARVVIGSANLTRAGYRNQVELGMALDLDSQCKINRQVFEDLSLELRSMLELASGDATTPGPIQRAAQILDLFDARVSSLSLPETAPAGLRFAIAAGRRGLNPLEKLGAVWSGTPPQSVIALSPFWDDQPGMPGARAVLDQLAKRASTGERTRATFVVPVDVTAGAQIVRAPGQLRQIADRRIESNVVAFRGNDERRLHAKCIQYASATWQATMFGSSNVTSKGLGLETNSHRELNLWVGCRTNSPYADALAQLIPMGDSLDGSLTWAPEDDDEDETTLHPLPLGFGEALLITAQTLRLSFTNSALPAQWDVGMLVPGSPKMALTNSEAWHAQGQPSVLDLRLPPGLDALPSLLEVSWTDGTQAKQAAWFVNVGDVSVLPAPTQLKELPADVLLAILASTRPLRQALEKALRDASTQDQTGADELDPLRRFDSTGLLLHRTRRSSAALWGIEKRLSQRLHSAETLEWRLAGPLGPEHLARKLVEAAQMPGSLAGEQLFLLAELALTVRRVDWAQLCGELPVASVRQRVQQSLDLMDTLCGQLEKAQDVAPIQSYARAVFEEVKK